MTNAELADRLERRGADYDAAESAWHAAPTNQIHYDWLVDQKCRLADVTRCNLPAIIAALRRDAPVAGDALTALRAVMSLNSVKLLFEAAEEYPHGEEDVAAELSALRLARDVLRRQEPPSEEVLLGEDICAQLDRLADYLAPLHGAWTARTAARELRDCRLRYRAVAHALCSERGFNPDEVISDAGNEAWELVGYEAVQNYRAALAAAQEGS